LHAIIIDSSSAHPPSQLYATPTPTQFGILLFEILTGERPFAGFPNALLGHVSDGGWSAFRAGFAVP